MRIAYADPPYPGCANLYPEKSEVDHKELITDLQDYDGWALSTSSPALRDVLAMCPPKIRVMAWVKPFAAFKANVSPAYAWEPVLISPARKPLMETETCRDWVSVPITMQKGMIGAKPERFSFWLFEMLGLRQEDEFIDLFPGSGAVWAAWEKWKAMVNYDSLRLEQVSLLP